MNNTKKTVERGVYVMNNFIPHSEKIKIGIISINAHTLVLNFASVLHSVAFSKIISELGYENVIVNYYPNYYPKNFDPKYPLLNYLKRKDSQENRAQIKIWTEMFYARKERYKKIQAFIEKYYNFTEKEYTAALFDEIDGAEEINCYIVATDVIWKYPPRAL